MKISDRTTNPIANAKRQWRKKNLNGFRLFWKMIEPDEQKNEKMIEDRRIKRATTLSGFKNFWNRLDPIQSDPVETMKKIKKLNLRNNLGSKRRRRLETLSFFRFFWNKIEKGLCDNNEFEQKLNWEMINGLLLSDAHLTRRNRQNSRFELIQTIRNAQLPVHVGYHFKDIGLSFAFIENHYPTISWIGSQSIIGKPTYGIRSGRNIVFSKLRSKWYPQGKKIIPDDLVLTPQTISFWFQGDGSSTFVNTKRQKGRVYVTLSTESFTFSDCNKLIEQLKSFGIDNAYIKLTRLKAPTITIGRQKEVMKFMELVQPWILPCFEYKIKKPILETLDYTPFLGKSHTQKTKDLISIKRIEYWKNKKNQTKENNSVKK